MGEVLSSIGMKVLDVLLPSLGTVIAGFVVALLS